MEEYVMARKMIEKKNFLGNLILYYASLGVIVLGYVFLSMGDANSFTSLTLGPIILVLGYIIAIPIALLVGVTRKDAPDNTDTTVPKTRLGRNT